MQASVDRRYTIQSAVGYRHDHQDFSRQHHDLSASARGGIVDACAFPEGLSRVARAGASEEVALLSVL
jgi:hypothetical protein